MRYEYKICGLFEKRVVGIIYKESRLTRGSMLILSMTFIFIFSWSFHLSPNSFQFYFRLQITSQLQHFCPLQFVLTLLLENHKIFPFPIFFLLISLRIGFRNSFNFRFTFSFSFLIYFTSISH